MLSNEIKRLKMKKKISLKIWRKKILKLDTDESPYKRCPSLCCPMVVGSEWLCWWAVWTCPSQPSWSSIWFTGLLEVEWSDGRCWDLGNLSRTRRVGDGWSSVLLAKARYRLVHSSSEQPFQLRVIFRLYFQGPLYILSNKGSQAILFVQDVCS